MTVKEIPVLDHRHRSTLLVLSKSYPTGITPPENKIRLPEPLTCISPFEKKCQAEVQTLMQLQELR
jgi:hypothetical protein